MYYLHGGAGQLEKLRKPLRVSRATYERAHANLTHQSMEDRIDLTNKAVWARNHAGLDVPYWHTKDYVDRDGFNPRSDLIYSPFWMTNRSRARLIQRPNLIVKPDSHVLIHPATDEVDGLGKGFKPLKMFKRAVTFKASSFSPKHLMGAMASIWGGILTAGLGPALAPKIFSANSKTMQTMGLAATAVGVAAGAVVLAPAISSYLGPVLSKASGLLGKSPVSMTSFFKMFNGLSSGMRQQVARQITPQQVADIQRGLAYIDPNTGQVMYYSGQGGTLAQIPGSSFFPQAGMIPPQPDASIMPMPQYQTPQDPFGSSPTSQAGMLDGLSPTTLGLLIGVPVVLQLLSSKSDSGRRT